MSFCQEEISDNLILNKPQIISTNDGVRLGFTIPEYRVILQMYSAYQLYIDTRDDIKIINNKYKLELSQCNKRIEIKNAIIETIGEDRNFIYTTLNKTQSDYIKDLRKQRIKTIFIASGTGLAGFGLGTLIFFIISR